MFEWRGTSQALEREARPETDHYPFRYVKMGHVWRVLNDPFVSTNNGTIMLNTELLAHHCCPLLLDLTAEPCRAVLLAPFNRVVPNYPLLKTNQHLLCQSTQVRPWLDLQGY